MCVCLPNDDNNIIVERLLIRMLIENDKRLFYNTDNDNHANANSNDIFKRHGHDDSKNDIIIIRTWHTLSEKNMIYGLPYKL